MENCVMLAEYHDEDEVMPPVVTERIATIENEMKHLRQGSEEARKESREDRANVRDALEAHIQKVAKEQAEIKASLAEISDFIQQAKGIKWFVGFVTTTAATLSSIGIYKLFFPK